MNKNIHYYKLTIDFDTPIISQAIGTLAFGYDAAMQRDNQGNPVLSGSMIKGNIRHALEDFQTITQDKELTAQINRWFGKKTKGSHDYEHRSDVEFDFFWKLSTQDDYTKIANAYRTRISIDNEKGKVKESTLQVTEDCFPVGTGEVSFSGHVTARFAKNESRVFQRWLNKSLDYIPAIGSFKGIGFGRICNHELQGIKNPYQQLQKAPELAGNTRYRIQLELDRPFCLGRPKTADSNRIHSSENIAGNVIKGLIARAYHYDDKCLENELCFDQLIISHALPAKVAGERKSTKIPLSYALVDGMIEDFTFIESNNQSWKKAPAFAPDWKPADEKKVRENCQLEALNLAHYLTVKTGIDAEYGTSKEAQLFSLDCIDPEYEDNEGKIHHHVWCADIELCNIPVDKQQQVAENLQKIFNQGLHGIGKTKANAKVTVNYKKPYQHIPTQISGYDADTFIIRLITPAKILPAGLQISSINSHTQLKQNYQDYWHQIDKNIELTDYFAQQTIESSYYHLKRHGGAEHYQPDYLTCAGSVFKLKITSEPAKQALHKCLRTGLPTYGISEDNKQTWKTSPYLPEHGYGEIVLHKKSDCNKQQVKENDGL